MKFFSPNFLLFLTVLWVVNSEGALPGRLSLIHVASTGQLRNWAWNEGTEQLPKKSQHGFSLTCLVPWCSLTSLCLSPHCISSSRTSPCGLGNLRELHDDRRESALLTWWLASTKPDTESARPVKGYTRSGTGSLPPYFIIQSSQRALVI